MYKTTKIIKKILILSFVSIFLLTETDAMADSAEIPGPLFINNSGNNTSGLVVSTDVGSTATNPLVLFQSKNSSFYQSILQVKDNRATGGTVFLIDAIREGTTGGDAIIAATGYGINTKGTFIGRAARGTESSPSALKTNDEIVFFGGRGYGSTKFPALASSAIIAKAGEDWTDSKQGSYMVFETTPVGQPSSKKSQSLKISSKEVVFNEYGINTDFRVEGSATNNKLFFVDAAQNKVTVQSKNSGGSVESLILQNPYASSATSVSQIFASTNDPSYNTNGLTKLVSARQADGSSNFSFVLSPGNGKTTVERIKIIGSSGDVEITGNVHVGGETSANSIRAGSYKDNNGLEGLTQDILVKGADGNNCTLSFGSGLLISENCP